ncbi:hypothetical protein [Candidatus Thiosymbion oneisti]|uniref:hypothetical protein n=1 Tax=Candidatus Thiosymbion oneisti TaxID=589554 RepID=UPI0013FD247E|nr:hypothetical protein [Candidatus Thiosymbion oneisti]
MGMIYLPQMNANERKAVVTGSPSTTALDPVAIICVDLRSFAAKSSVGSLLAQCYQ